MFANLTLAHRGHAQGRRHGSWFGLLSMLVLITALAVVPAGCNNPGPANVQRARAQWYDPYPSNDLGPAISGGRPQGFDKPYAEPIHSQFERWSYGRSQAPD